MGQAKRRGTLEQRAAEATIRARRQFPESVTCNHCKADLHEIHPMDVRSLPGMRLAGAAHCSACNHDTWVLDGDENGLQLFQQFLTEQHGSEAVSAGQVLRPQG
jgi:hypothetical protein